MELSAASPSGSSVVLLGGDGGTGDYDQYVVQQSETDSHRSTLSTDTKTRDDDLSTDSSASKHPHASEPEATSDTVLEFSEEDSELFHALFNDISDARETLASIARDQRQANALYSKAVNSVVDEVDEDEDATWISRLARVAKLIAAARPRWSPPQQPLIDVLRGVRGPALHKEVLDAIALEDSSKLTPVPGGRCL